MTALAQILLKMDPKQVAVFQQELDMLQALSAENKSLSAVAPHHGCKRLGNTRWCLALQPFNFNLVHGSGALTAVVGVWAFLGSAVAEESREQAC